MRDKPLSALGFANASNPQFQRYPPDISDLAWRGGLPNTISTYRLDDLDGQLFIQASGNSTATVNQCVLFGLAKDVHDARIFCRQFRDKAEPVLVRQRFANLRWRQNEWIQTEIIDGRDSTDDVKIARELFAEIMEEVPQLRQWPPSALDERPYLVKQGEIACRFVQELNQVNRLCRPKPQCEKTLQTRFPDLSFWQERESISAVRRRDFEDRFHRRGAWKADEIYDCIADLMRANSGETVKNWCKAFRRWQRKHCPPFSA